MVFSLESIGNAANTKPPHTHESVTFQLLIKIEKPVLQGFAVQAVCHCISILKTTIAYAILITEPKGALRL